MKVAPNLLNVPNKIIANIYSQNNKNRIKIYLSSHNNIMKLYIEILKLIFKKIIMKKNTGTVLKDFSENMGIVYIKLAQILATQNIGDIFTEDERVKLSGICDNVNEISYREIKKILKEEYGKNLYKTFRYIDRKPTASGSVSQVHRGILRNGDVVAIKIKRKDITENIDKDIKKIKKLIHRYAKIFKFGNIKGADLALDLYLDWIRQETDFKGEIKNIKIYEKYLNSVNEKIKDTKILKVPKLYEDYSTDNIIVMEYVKYKTINQMKLTKKNIKKITEALNTYIKLNFWAMFHDEKIAFHGDPHSANLALDDDGNLYFLDMGLLFVLEPKESKLCRDFFLTIYKNNYEKLYDMLIIYANLNEKQKKKFKENCKKYCNDVKDKNVTHYFIDLITICLEFEFVPPSFLFNMAKAFICIYGICTFTNNNVSAEKLLKNEITEFIIRKNINNITKILNDTKNIEKEIIIDSITKIISNDTLKEDTKVFIEDLEELIEILLKKNLKLTNML